MADDGTERVSEARTRLLATASRIFYLKGIHAVGVEEIVDEAQVTRATLYRHFRSKDGLIVAYLQAASQAERESLTALLEEAPSGVDAIRQVAAAVEAQIQNPSFRGCAFLNAAAEYPDEEHPAHPAVLEHRRWFMELVTSAMQAASATDPERSAELFVMLRDGAMAAGCLADPDDVIRIFRSGVDGLVATL
ncbi:TetR/AcrR family transcriptional regulator [Nocardioides sp.]|uniref:TetR/AcrR family transcriptional regulator n=1 Tax=Nocardioides sp. TaxID=35761 RepID=UPI0035B0664B